MAAPERRELRAEDFDPRDLELIADYLAQRLSYLDALNRRPSDPVTTAAIRGRIAEVQHMASLVSPKLMPKRPGAVGETISDMDVQFMERFLRSAGPQQ